MAFYIRKAFKAGPLRFNLSKGGIGISAGVTGARIGINRRGAYVHGGRHGLYYRQRVGGKRRGGAGESVSGPLSGEFGQTSVANERADGGRKSAFVDPAGTISLYKDTGVLYPSAFADCPTPNWPEFPPIPKWSPVPEKTLVWTALALLLGSFWFVMIFLPILAVGAIFFARKFMRHTANLKSGGHFSRQFMRWMQHPESGKTDILSALQHFFDDTDPEYQHYFVPLWYSRLLDRLLVADAGTAVARSLQQQFPAIESALDYPKRAQRMLKIAMLHDTLEQSLDDHVLTPSEESRLLEMVHVLGLSTEDVSPVMHMVQLATGIRDAVEQPITTQSSPVELTRGEQCVGIFAPVRLVRERVLHRYQRDRITYRELGYEIDLEGELILTDKRILIRPFGVQKPPSETSIVREYRLNRFVDVVADPARNLLELMFSDRQNPICLTAPESIIIASRLEKLVEITHRTPSE